jgi:hypothetical protein
MREASGRPGPGTLAVALAWRTRREGVRYLLGAFVPFVLIITLTVVVPLFPGGSHAINGAQADAGVGLRFGARGHPVLVGLLLLLIPGMVALCVAIGVGRAVRGLIGEEVGRGGLEELLGAPYSVGGIAAALLGCALTVATFLWAVMSALGALTIGGLTVATHDRLSLGGSYLALALVLPLLTSWAGAALALLVSVVFPRLTQLGAGVSLAGSNLASGTALLPGLAALLTLLIDSGGVGSVGFLALAVGAAAAVTVVTVPLAAYLFRAERVLDS